MMHTRGRPRLALLGLAEEHEVWSITFARDLERNSSSEVLDLRRRGILWSDLEEVLFRDLHGERGGLVLEWRDLAGRRLLLTLRLLLLFFDGEVEREEVALPLAKRTSSDRVIVVERVVEE